MKLSERDRKLIWHPFTQEKTAALPIAIQKAKGSYVYDEEGRAYLDLISSWWVNLHGHAHPAIANSIYQQANTLEHVIFAGFTHEPAVRLCERLAEIVPSTLSRFFFSDNGSTSIEVALKMAYQYWHNQGQPERSLFLSFEGAYHGDTFGAMAVGRGSGFHHAFAPLLFEVLTVPFPATWDEDEEVEQKEQHALETLDLYLKEHGRKIAAFILEPLVQGASGMRMCRPEFVKAAVERVQQQGIFVIFDEVMTGFGRTGTCFALEQMGIVPDFLCLSKGITGGFLPLALTITTQSVYEAFLSAEWKTAFAHGHSYTANPLACAAGLASLDLLVRSDTQVALKTIYETHKGEMQSLRRTCRFVQHTRVRGTIAAFEVESKAYADLNHKLKIRFLEEGLLIRPLGNTVYLLPPYCTTAQQLSNAYQKVSTIINELA